jgi:hypothetical protein
MEIENCIMRQPGYYSDKKYPNCETHLGLGIRFMLLNIRISISAARVPEQC